MKEVELELSNIGGLKGKHKFKFKEGLNTVKAGNAVGKTSLQKAIELLGIDKNDLKGKKHYANLFGSNTATVKATGSIECNRRFRIHESGQDLLDAGGHPIIETGAGHISGICFATPENTLINRLLDGKSIESFIERFSDSEHYDTAIDVLDDIFQKNERKLSSYQETITRINETEKTIKELEKEKTELEKELNNLPPVDKEKAMKNQKKFEETREEMIKKRDRKIDNKTKLNEINDTIEQLNNEIEIDKEEKESLEKRFPEIDKKLKKIDGEIPTIHHIIEKLNLRISQNEDDLKIAQENKTIRTKYGKNNGNVCHACGKPLTAKEIQKRIEKIEEDLEDDRKAIKKQKRKLNDINEEKEELEKKELRISRLDDIVSEKIDSLSRRESEAVEIEEKIKKYKKEIDELEKKIEDMKKDKKEFKKYQERDKLETQIKENEKTIEQRQKRLKDLEDKIIDVDKLQEKKNFLEKAVKHMKTRRNEVVDAVRVKFNKIINNLYKKMGYKHIEQIQINRDYTITMTKKDGGKEVEDFPLEALSASERVTLGVGLLMIAKQEYLPNFPFFVLDELVTSYDPTRFEKIKQFIKDISDYVIITELTKGDKIEIQHEI